MLCQWLYLLSTTFRNAPPQWQRCILYANRLAVSPPAVNRNHTRLPFSDEEIVVQHLQEILYAICWAYMCDFTRFLTPHIAKNYFNYFAICIISHRFPLMWTSSEHALIQRSFYEWRAESKTTHRLLAYILIARRGNTDISVHQMNTQSTENYRRL